MPTRCVMSVGPGDRTEEHRRRRLHVICPSTGNRVLGFRQAGVRASGRVRGARAGVAFEGWTRS